MDSSDNRIRILSAFIAALPEKDFISVRYS